MNKKLYLATACALSLLGSVGQTPVHAFTAQLPISAYEFAGPIRIVNYEIGSLTSVYTVPSDRIAVITDIYITLADGASGTHKTYLTNNFLEDVGGPYIMSEDSPFVLNLTSGMTWTGGKQIVVSDTGGSGDVVVNLYGYLVCSGSCD